MSHAREFEEIFLHAFDRGSLFRMLINLRLRYAVAILSAYTCRQKKVASYAVYHLF